MGLSRRRRPALPHRPYDQPRNANSSPLPRLVWHLLEHAGKPPSSARQTGLQIAEYVGGGDWGFGA